MHPLVDNLDQFSESELESKIGMLTKNYFMTNNYSVQMQIQSILETYKYELNQRRTAEWNKNQELRNKDLDKLINID